MLLWHFKNGELCLPTLKITTSTGPDPDVIGMDGETVEGAEDNKVPPVVLTWDDEPSHGSTEATA